MAQKKLHHHSGKERQIAFDYLKQGKTIKETAELCDVSISTIKNWKRTFALRGKGYKKDAKYPYANYSHELKCHVVQEYLKGKDATELALLFGILNPTSITVWARDERFRGGIALEDEKRPKKNNKKRKSTKPIEDMTLKRSLSFSGWKTQY